MTSLSLQDQAHNILLFSLGSFSDEKPNMEKQLLNVFQLVFKPEVNNLSKMIKREAPYILAVAAAFFVYQLYLLVNSFPAVYSIYLTVFSSTPTGPSFWSLVWFSSEFIGEIGLVIRFVGACFFVAFVWLLFRKNAFFFSLLSKAVLFEGSYYLFILPFVVFLFTLPYDSTMAQIVGQEAALSYALQTVFVSPVFFVLYNKLKRPNMDSTKLLKWGAIGIVNFTFALWVKHLLLNIYALPIDVADPILFAGFLNSALTLLIAALVLTVTFLPVIREKSFMFSSRGMGVGLVLIGVYFIIYVLVAMLNQRYFSFLELTELWAITMPIVGLSLVHKRVAFSDGI